MSKRSLFLIVGITLSSIWLSACTTPAPVDIPANPESDNEQQVQVAPPDAQPRTIEITAWEDGQTALALLQTVATVQLMSFGFGEFIEGVNGLMGDADNYWAFYVNDEYAQAGADQTTLTAGDVVKFVYEPVTTSPMLEEAGN